MEECKMAENAGYELGWDDPIGKESPEFVVLPEGDYDFEVIDFERARHNGSEKLPPCGKAIIHIKIEGEQGVSVIRHNLFMYSTCEGMLSEFFMGIGQRKKGQKEYKMNWNAVKGAKGRAKVGIREYNGNKYNEIKRFYEPEESKGFQPGRF
jgi:hypothetical protein